MKGLLIGLLFVTVSAAGCAGLSPTQQRTLTGGMGGAATGAMIGAMAGDAGMGAGIGAAVGIAGGFLYGKHKESEEAAYQQGYAAGQQSR